MSVLSKNHTLVTAFIEHLKTDGIFMNNNDIYKYFQSESFKKYYRNYTKNNDELEKIKSIFTNYDTINKELQIKQQTYNEKINNLNNELIEEPKNTNKYMTDLKKTKQKKNEKTKQKENEDNHLEQFIIISPEYGLKYISSWGNGSKNKKKNKNTDDDVKIIDIKKLKNYFIDQEDKNFINDNYSNGDIITINRKTEKGKFTWFNGGTNITSILYKFLELHDKKNFKECFEQVNNIKKKYIEEVNIKEKYIDKDKITWDDIGQEKKQDIFEKIQILWFENIKDNEEKFYNFYNERFSDFNYIGDKLIVAYKKKLIYDKTVKVKKIGKNKLEIGELIIRFKSESRKIKSSIKMNCEYKINQ